MYRYLEHVSCVVSIFDICQICDVMYCDGAGEEMKFLGFHLQMQLLHNGWAALINVAQ